MICPACKNENEMAYSGLFHGFVCLEQPCGMELEMDESELAILLADSLLTESIEEPVYA